MCIHSVDNIQEKGPGRLGFPKYPLKLTHEQSRSLAAVSTWSVFISTSRNFPSMPAQDLLIDGQKSHGKSSGRFSVGVVVVVDFHICLMLL